jgi:alpha-tubulin suppressor-like RCC1 family protein
MANRVCTRFIDDDGLDIGCHLVSKEYALEAYPELVPWMKTPALWVWGTNNFGMLGDNSITNRSSPVQTVSGGTNWKIMSSNGTGTSSAIKTDGTLWLWGTGSVGRLGNNNVINASSPVQTVSGGTNWKSVSVGSSAAMAIKTDNSLWLWGNNTNGELGTGDNVQRSSPVQTVSAGTNWKSVDATLHTVAIKNDGTLWAWGYNQAGQLGDNSALNRNSPVQTVAVGTNWSTLSTGRYHTAAIKTDGTLWMWGYNVLGQLGNNLSGGFASRSSPVQTVSAGTNWKQVGAGRYNTAAIKLDGSLWIWGGGAIGRNGTNNAASVSSPVQTVSAGTNWKRIELGYSHSVAIKTDGSLWLWGCGLQLGTDVVTNRSSPVQTVSGGTGWRSFQAGSTFVLAIRDEGEF